MYLAATYVAPESSPIHNIYNDNIFKLIETDIFSFKELGKVFLTGDFNPRVGRKCDFIENDRRINDDTSMDVDTPLLRNTCDMTSNRVGDLLLEICKATNVRIVNGRLHDDKNTGKVTCITHNGQSLVDYLITDETNFSDITQFTVGDLNTFSNHAPIVFSFRIGTYIIPQTSNTGNSYKWNPLHREQWLHDISRDVGTLEQHLTDGISAGLNTDMLVEQFTTFLVSTGNQYFQHTNNATKHTRFSNADRNKQKWYNAECKRRHDEYKLAVNTTIIEMM